MSTIRRTSETSSDLVTQPSKFIHVYKCVHVKITIVSAPALLRVTYFLCRASIIFGGNSTNFIISIDESWKWFPIVPFGFADSHRHRFLQRLRSCNSMGVRHSERLEGLIACMEKSKCLVRIMTRSIHFFKQSFIFFNFEKIEKYTIDYGGLYESDE